MTLPQRGVTEQHNLQSHLAGEEPPGISVTLWVSEAPAGSLHRVRDVWQVIAAADREAWPSEEEWRGLLPVWLLEAFDDPNIARRDDAWDVGSWLASLEERSWLWWSCDSLGAGWLVRLALSEWPCGAIGALEWLVLLATQFVQVEVRGDLPFMLVRTKGADAI